LFVETTPVDAELVIFGTDEIDTLRQSDLYKSFRSKSISITETDIPTYHLPGLYAANEKSFLTHKRTRTMSYFISQRDRGNPEIARLLGQPQEKTYLYSFMGGSNSWPRKHIFRRLKSGPDTVIEATDHYNHWSEAQDPEAKNRQRRRYASVIASSKFALCPRGCGLSSYRLFESMSLGVAPVVISDRWRPIEGVDWSFALFVPERKIPDLDNMLRARESEWADRGRAGLAAYHKHFAAPAIPATLHRDLTAIAAELSPARETIMSAVTRARVAKRAVSWAAYKGMKYLILKGFHITGLDMPVKLHQPVEEQVARVDARFLSGKT
jgi:hypothetical protein